MPSLGARTETFPRVFECMFGQSGVMIFEGQAGDPRLDHLREWIDGGLTNLDNMTLLCRYHHHNFAGHGWTCTLNADRRPAWTPPWWIDREQKPRINTRIIARQLDLHRKRSARSTPSLGANVTRAKPAAGSAKLARA